MGKRSSIEINGKHYDARSGHPLIAKPKHIANNIDGVQRVGHQKVHHAPKLKTASASKTHQTAHAKSRSSHPATGIHRKTQRTQTLMRHGLKKPTALPRISSITSSPIEIARAINEVADTASLQLTSIADIERSKRAQHIKKHRAVQHFNFNPPMPGEVITPVQATQETSVQSVQPAKITHPKHHPAAKVPPLPSTIASATHGRLDKMVDQALASSNHHVHPKHHRRSALHRVKHAPRLASIGASVAIIAVLGAFFVYQNMPNLALRMANQQSGFEARLPGYKPSGFSMSKPAYNNGEVAINFQANADSQRRFTLSQRSSSWTSQTLLNNYVATSGRQYQTLEGQGKMIYVYGDSAAWVDQGILYNIHGNASLSSDQLLRLANSI